MAEDPSINKAKNDTHEKPRQTSPVNPVLQTPAPKEVGESTAEKGSTQDLKSPPPVTPPISVICNHTQGEPPKDKVKWTDVAIVLLTIGIVALARCQYEATTGQLTQMQNQTTLMRQQLVGTQAAVLKINKSFPIEGFEIELVNTRDVDAMNAHLKVTMTPVSLPDGVPLGESVVHEDTAQRIEKDNPFYHLWSIPWPVRREMEDGWPGTRTVKVSGEYSYEDGFGDKMPVEKFCVIWLPQTKVVLTLSDNTVATMRPCESYRDTIRDIQAAQKEAVQQKMKAN